MLAEARKKEKNQNAFCLSRMVKPSYAAEAALNLIAEECHQRVEHANGRLTTLRGSQISKTTLCYFLKTFSSKINHWPSIDWLNLIPD